MLADLLFADQLHDRLKAVVVGPQELGVEIIQPRQLSGSVETLVPDQAPDQGPVLLLDMGVVVLVLGSRARDEDLSTWLATVLQGRSRKVVKRFFELIGEAAARR